MKTKKKTIWQLIVRYFKFRVRKATRERRATYEYHYIDRFDEIKKGKEE